MQGLRKQAEQEQAQSRCQAIHSRDFLEMFASRPSVEEVNAALGEVHQKLALKSDREECRAVLEHQSAINRLFRHEMIAGRWRWGSGELKRGGLVPWEEELHNHCPKNLLWEADKASLYLLSPGFYEVTLHLFSRRKCQISLQINGETVVSKEKATNTSRQRDICHSIHFSEIVKLPGKSRLSVCVVAESRCAEAFLAIKDIFLS